MNKVSFEVTVFSHSRESLEKICSESSLHFDHIQDGDVSAVCILSVNTTDFDTDDAVHQTIIAIRGLDTLLKEHIVTDFSIRVDIEIVETDGNETPIPGIVFPADYILLASDLEIKTRFHLMIDSSTKKGLLNSGAYFYIMSDNEIDVEELNQVAHTQPSILYRKGYMGRYTIVNFNSWGIEISSDNNLPTIPILSLMKRLWNAKQVGVYCMNNRLTSHVDITCYSIPPEPLLFNLEPSFFTFLKDLSVQYLDMDFMT